MGEVTPYLLYASCEEALDFLARAFGFEEVLRHTGPDGRVSHAEMTLDGARIFMGNPGEGYRGPREVGETVGIYVEVADADVVYERARGGGRRARGGAERHAIRAPSLRRARSRGPPLVVRARRSRARS